MVITAWLAELILITMRDVKKGSTNSVAGFPLPADYLASFGIFGVLAALPPSASTFAGVTAWGFVVATALNFFDPTLNKAGNANGTGTAASVGGVTQTSSGTASATQVIPASIPTASIA
jgi:hypothetical protein